QTLLQPINQVVQASSDLAIAILRAQREAFSEWCRDVEEDRGATEQQEVKGDRRPITNQDVCRLQDRLGIRVLRRWHRDYFCMRLPKRTTRVEVVAPQDHHVMLPGDGGKTIEENVLATTKGKDATATLILRPSRGKKDSPEITGNPKRLM